MKNLIKVIIWFTFFIGGIMLTGMSNHDWPTVVWLVVWLLVGVYLLELSRASDQDGDSYI